METWTLWLLTFGTVIGNGGATPTVNPLATYATHEACANAMLGVNADLRTMYNKPTPNVGVFFCVFGTPVKH